MYNIGISRQHFQKRLIIRKKELKNQRNRDVLSVYKIWQRSSCSLQAWQLIKLAN